MIDPEDEQMTTLEETLYLAKERWPADVRWIGSLTDEQKQKIGNAKTQEELLAIRNRL